MADIVERLRLVAEHDWRTSILAHTPDTAAEAAAEILSLRAQLNRAVAAEREACAMVAQAWAHQSPNGVLPFAACIASAIRARGDQSP
jgi:hypothetical protein